MQRQSSAYKTKGLCINDLYVKELSQIASKQLSKQQMGDEINVVNRKYEGIRAKQKFVNELKIYLELNKLSEEAIRAYSFDFNKFVDILTRKSYLINSLFIKQAKNSEQEKQFHKIEIELAYLLSGINANFIFSIQYPVKELLEVKNSLIVRQMKRRKDKLSAEASTMRQNIYQMQSQAKDLQTVLIGKKRQIVLLQQQSKNKLESKVINYKVEKSQIQPLIQSEEPWLVKFDWDTYKDFLMVKQRELQAQLNKLKKGHAQLKRSIASKFIQSFVISRQPRPLPKYPKNPQLSSQILLLRSQLQNLQATTRKITSLKKLKGEADILMI